MDMIDRLRAFNRIYTSELGFLEKNYLRSGLSLTEIRVLYEIAHGPEARAREIARLLRLDEGYLSRIIRAFERRGLVGREVDPGDRRSSVLRLTSAGAGVMSELETASRQDMGAVLERVPAASRGAMDQSLATIRHVLGGVTGPVRLRGLQPGDPGWVIKAQGEAYARDEGYDLTFEALVAGITSELVGRIGQGLARAWIAEAEGDRLGCIFYDTVDAETAKLRMFYVEPRARGLGLGRQLLDRCIGAARRAGFARMVLWTHESHRQACRLYEQAGFVVTSSEPMVEFGVPSVSQNWELTL